MMPISWSSTTEARRYVGSKSNFSRTGPVGNDAWTSLRDPKTLSSGPRQHRPTKYIRPKHRTRNKPHLLHSFECHVSPQPSVSSQLFRPWGSNRTCRRSHSSPSSPTPLRSLPPNPVRTSPIYQLKLNPNIQRPSGNAHRIRVFDPRYPLSLEFLRPKVVEQNSPESTEVQDASW